MLTPLVFSLCIVAALGLFLHQLWGRFNVLRAVASVERLRPHSRADQGRPRLRLRPEEVRAPAKQPPRGRIAPGWMHFFIFWGFTILGVQVVHMFARGFLPDFHLPLFASDLLGGPYLLLKDIMEVLVLGAIGVALFRWLHLAPAAALRLSRRRRTGCAASRTGKRILILCFIGTHHDRRLALRRRPLSWRMPTPGRSRRETAWQPFSRLGRSRLCSPARRAGAGGVRRATSAGGCTTASSWSS